MTNYKDAKYNFSGAGLTAIPTSAITSGTFADARISSGSVTQHVTAFDDNQIQNNIALLGFKTAVNGSLAKYNLVDQIVDEYSDATGVDTSASTNEVLTSGVYGSSSSGTLPTGGTITTVGSYKVHSFTSTGNTNFIVSASGDVDSLIVAGGGGGGGCDQSPGGGGGGAGGLRALSSVGVTAQTYVITVGTGGTGTVGDGAVGSPYVEGTQGGNSSALGNSATGGGLGGSYGRGGANEVIHRGGSGGGMGFTSGGGDGNVGSYSPVEGYAGSTTTSGTAQSSSGGGGAGAIGSANFNAGEDGGAGGVGVSNDWRTGSGVYYSGGGGGGMGHTADGANGAGGNGGGGAGGDGGSGRQASDGRPGTDGLGGGGGGASTEAGALQQGGDGGNGIVVIRYLTTAFDTYNALTLQSLDTTASTANPDYANMIVLMENSAGTATLNTDIKGYISEDSGVTFTQGTLVDEGTWGTNKKIIAFHDLDISAQTGSAMCYKITTHNQSAAKITKVHATSIGWR